MVKTKSDILMCRLLISTIRMLDLLDVPLGGVHSLLQIRLTKGVLLLLDRDVVGLGLGLWLINFWTTWMILSMVPPSLIFLGVPKGWSSVLEI